MDKGQDACTGWRPALRKIAAGPLLGVACLPLAELDGAGNPVSRFVYGSHVNAPDFMVKNAVSHLIVTDQGRDLLARGAAEPSCYIADQ